MQLKATLRFSLVDATKQILQSHLKYSKPTLDSGNVLSHALELSWILYLLIL